MGTATSTQSASRRLRTGADDDLRPLGHPRRGPSGRAALGGLLVSLAIVVLFTIAQDRGQTGLERYVVARHQLAIGTRLTAGDLTTATLHVPAGPLRQHVFGQSSALLGAVVVAPLGPGELIQASAVVAQIGGADERQISVPIDTARALGDRLSPGELVDVIATFGTGGDAFTVTVVSAARVVSRDTTGGALGDHKTEIVTLAVHDAQSAIAVAHAVAAGEIAFVRVTGANDDGPTPDAYRAPRPSR